jgi:hypothetical protein
MSQVGHRWGSSTDELRTVKRNLAPAPTSFVSIRVRAQRSGSASRQLHRPHCRRERHVRQGLAAHAQMVATALQILFWATKGGPCRITSDTGTPNTQHTTPALSSTYPGPPARRPGLRSAHQTGSGRSFPLLDWLRVGIPSLEKNRLEASHESPRSIAEQASRQPARPCWRAHRFVPSCRGEARPIIVAARSVLSCVRRSCRTLAAVEAYTSTAQTTVDLDLLSSPFRLEFVQVSGAPIG